MTKGKLIEYISKQHIITTNQVRRFPQMKIFIYRTDNGIFIKEGDDIYCYYDNDIKCFVEFFKAPEEVERYKYKLIDKIISTEHKIDTYIYLYPFRYSLRDYKMHVYIDYSPKQWTEIETLNYSPLLYDFEPVKSVV